MMIPIYDRAFDELLDEAVAFHGHLCPGQVLGVRMTTAGCRALDLAHPRQAGKRLVVLVEIDRCATDAIEALTGASLGKRTLKHIDHGKTAATFVDTLTGAAVRVAAREEARELARLAVPSEPDPRRAQTAAYRTLPEPDLLKLQAVTVDPAWLARRRVRVTCDACGEAVHYQREVWVGDHRLCRACAGDRYYRVVAGTPGMTPVIPAPTAIGHDSPIDERRIR